MSEPTQRTDDRLTLRVKDLGFGHDVHNHPGHAPLLAVRS
jgi:hypothetical protein